MACDIMDGHMKGSRLVCGAVDAVSVKTDELGSFTLGCPNTPLLRSYYCLKHQVCVMMIDQIMFIISHTLFKLNVINSTPKSRNI